jgi:hypothetical protein
MDGKVVKRPPKRKEDRIILQFVRLTVLTLVVMVMYFAATTARSEMSTH